MVCEWLVANDTARFQAIACAVLRDLNELWGEGHARFLVDRRIGIPISCQWCGVSQTGRIFFGVNNTRLLDSGDWRG
jgi:hypothetical protein